MFEGNCVSCSMFVSIGSLGGDCVLELSPCPTGVSLVGVVCPVLLDTLLSDSGNLSVISILLCASANRIGFVSILWKATFNICVRVAFAVVCTVGILFVARYMLMQVRIIFRRFLAWMEHEGLLTRASSALRICSWTWKSVFSPWKQLETALMMLSISSLCAWTGSVVYRESLF